MPGSGLGRLAGKRAVVTGAAMGLGQASAVALAEEGADLILLDREAEGLEETAAQVRALGRAVYVRVLNLTVQAEIEQAFAALREQAGPNRHFAQQRGRQCP